MTIIIIWQRPLELRFRCPTKTQWFLTSQVILSVVELPAYIYAVTSTHFSTKYLCIKNCNQDVLCKSCQHIAVTSTNFPTKHLCIKNHNQDDLCKSCQHIELDVVDWSLGKEARLFSLSHIHWSCTHCIRFHWGFDISQIIFLSISCVMFSLHIPIKPHSSLSW